MNNSQTSSEDITLFDARISRRGKGAKGSVEVKTLGKPVSNDAGLAKDFDYAVVEGYSEDKLIEFAKNIGNINKIIALGVDYLLKKASLGGGNSLMMLASEVMKRGLAIDRDEAKAIAQSMYTAKLNMAKFGLELDYNELYAKRELIVLKLNDGKLYNHVIDEVDDDVEMEEGE